MNLLDSLAVGLRALSVNKMRSMLTVLGIIIGVAAVVCMVSVGSGAREEVSEKIRTLGANLLVIRPGAQLSGAARLETGTRQTSRVRGDGRCSRRIRRCRPVTIAFTPGCSKNTWGPCGSRWGSRMKRCSHWGVSTPAIMERNSA